MKYLRHTLAIAQRLIFMPLYMGLAIVQYTLCLIQDTFNYLGIDWLTEAMAKIKGELFEYAICPVWEISGGDEFSVTDIMNKDETK